MGRRASRGAGRREPRGCARALVIANFKRWTMRELDLRREAASASELAEVMAGLPKATACPAIDWDRTNGRVLTIEWIDGIKISDVDALRARGHDLPGAGRRLVLSFPDAGDQRRLLPRRHAPGQPVRGG